MVQEGALTALASVADSSQVLYTIIFLYSNHTFFFKSNTFFIENIQVLYLTS